MTSLPAPPRPLLSVRDLSVTYAPPGRPPARALEGVSFDLWEREIVGVVGESGCGKTTLMMGTMGLLPETGRIDSGRVLLGDEDLLALDERAMARVRWQEMSMVFQGAMNALNPVHAVGRQIAEPIVRHEGVRDRRQLARRVDALLERVGISPARRDDFPHQFSGGMRQRVVIAMALACRPRILIADEPTTALDVMVQAQILDLLAGLRDEMGLAVLLVTHDLGVVAEICDSVLVMYGGVVVERGEVDAIYNAPRHPYTRALLRAFPDMQRPAAGLDPIPGTPPRLDHLPPGCRFAPRCPIVRERCQRESPPLIPLGDGQHARCFFALEGQEGVGDDG